MMKMTKWSTSTANGAKMSDHCQARMPEEERTGLYDATEEYAWDSDNGYPLDPGDDDDEEEE